MFCGESLKCVCFHLQHISIWSSHILSTQQSHVATMSYSTALEEFHVGRERLHCLPLRPNYSEQCLGFNKYSMNELI